MITLVANTVTKLLKGENRLRYFKISSDSTTVTRLGLSTNSIEMSDGGYAITAYESVVVALKPMEEIFAVSTGTPKISIAEAYNPVSAVRLY